jgi:hypothetical protein
MMSNHLEPRKWYKSLWVPFLVCLIMVGGAFAGISAQLQQQNDLRNSSANAVQMAEAVTQRCAAGEVVKDSDGKNVCQQAAAVKQDPVTPTTGPQGAQGEKGDKGDKGDTGDTGATGATGATGPKGDKGDKGDTGTDGTSTTGATGPKGDTGAQGVKGDTGETGATGATGPQGPAGPEGPAGPAGPAGPSPSSITFTEGPMAGYTCVADPPGSTSYSCKRTETPLL